MDDLTATQRHKAMSRVHSKDTSIEVILRRALWNEGIRYRKNYNNLPGKPDIAITKYKIAIFCDGELWHGYNWEKQKMQLKQSSNAAYWIAKIESNMQRDRNNDLALRYRGWCVLHFWGRDIKKHTDLCVQVVKEAIMDRIIDEGIVWFDE